MTIAAESLNGVKPKNMTLLDQALEGKDPEFQRRVLQWVVKTGIRENDELFLIMVAIGQLQFLLEQSPKDFQQMFDGWGERVLGFVEEAKRNALRGTETEIAAAVKRLIQKTESEQNYRLWSAILPAFGALLSTLGVGILLGMAVPIWLQGGYGDKPRRLTLVETETLTWAMGKEGQFARNLMRWNGERLDTKECLKEARQLNVTLRIEGKASKYGACLLWVVPPSGRQF